jgi:hypothetical protein
MRRSLLANAWLFAAVVALGLFVYLKPDSTMSDGHALSLLDPRDVSAIRIERDGTPDILLERRRDHWYIASPFSARADDFAIQRLTAILRARATHRAPAADLARFDLEQPQVRLTIDGQTFAFGMLNPVAREQFVLTGDAVYAINARYGLALPARAEALASRRLFGPDERPVLFELQDFSVAQREGTWKLAPAPQDWSQDDINRWADAWHHAIAARVEAGAPRQPRETLRVRLEDGRTLDIGVLALEPEIVLQRPDEALNYHFFAEAAMRLLAPPGTERKDP